jgi:Methylenetetrahydrofolate reductase
MDRMAILGPQFIDVRFLALRTQSDSKVTWNAGGRVGTLSCEIVKFVQSEIGIESCLHLVRASAFWILTLHLDMLRDVQRESRRGAESILPQF